MENTELEKGKKEKNIPDTFVQLDRDLILPKLFRIINRTTDFKPELEDTLVFDPKAKKFVKTKIRRRKSETINYCYEANQRKYSYEFSCFEILNEADARVLCAVGALASAKFGEQISPNDKSEETRAILGELKQEGIQFMPQRDLVPYKVETTCQNIVRSLGLSDSGENLEAVRRSLERLSKVHVKIETYDTIRETLSKVSFNLMTYAMIENAKSRQNTISIVFNAITAQALLGSMDGAIYIRSQEIGALTSKKAGSQLLHFHLCSQIKPGGKKAFYTETLESYLWKPTNDRKVKYKRKKELEEAIKGLEVIGWTGKPVDLKNGSGWEISRPINPPSPE